jgi:hypothetical protein
MHRREKLPKFRQRARGGSNVCRQQWPQRGELGFFTIEKASTVQGLYQLKPGLAESFGSSIRFAHVGASSVGLHQQCGRKR